jgi:hypothetical protein
MNLKKKIIALITKSGKDNKEVVAILDVIRTNYHNRKNVGDKVVSERELSSHMIAQIYNQAYPLSRDKAWVFYKGGWRKVRGESPDRHIIYIKANIAVKFKKI